MLMSPFIGVSTGKTALVFTVFNAFHLRHTGMTLETVGLNHSGRKWLIFHTLEVYAYRWSFSPYRACPQPFQ